MRALLSTAVSLATFVCVSTTHAQIAWQPDLQSAHKQAQATGKLILVHFYSDNCVWCDRLEEGAYKKPDVANAINQQFVPVKIHAGKLPNVASHFGVSQWPTDVIVDPSGLVHGRSVSPQAPAEYVAMLGKGLAHAGRGSGSNPATQIAQQIPPPASSPAFAAPPTTSPSMQVPATAVAYQMPPSAANYSPDASSPSLQASLSLPPAANEQSTGDSSAETGPPAPPPVALEGFCPVTIVEADEWKQGERKYGAIHMGNTYLFASEEAQKKFLTDPFRYAPVLSGLDVVRYFEGKSEVAGSREFSCKWMNRTYLFADQASLDRFYANYDQYHNIIERLESRIAAISSADQPMYR